MKLKTLLNKHNGKDAHLDFWAELETLSPANRLLFEEYCAMFFKAENQKAKKPGQARAVICSKKVLISTQIHEYSWCYFNRASTDCGDWFACANIAVAAC